MLLDDMVALFAAGIEGDAKQCLRQDMASVSGEVFPPGRGHPRGVRGRRGGARPLYGPWPALWHFLCMNPATRPPSST